MQDFGHGRERGCQADDAIDGTIQFPVTQRTQQDDPLDTAVREQNEFELGGAGQPFLRGRIR